MAMPKPKGLPDNIPWPPPRPGKPGKADQKPRKRPVIKNPELAATAKRYGPSNLMGKTPTGARTAGSQPATARQAAQNKAATERQARKKAKPNVRSTELPAVGATAPPSYKGTWPPRNYEEYLRYLNSTPAP